jgi:hypothetical protein
MDPVQAPVIAAKSFWSTIKAHWIFAFALFAAFAVLVMAKKSTIIAWFTSKDSTNPADKLPMFLRRWLGVAVVALASAGALLYSGDAFAAVCCGVPVHEVSSSAGWFAAHWQAVAGGLAACAGSLALGLTNFSAPDTIDCQEVNGGTSLTVTDNLTTTVEKALYIKSSEHSVTPIRKAPLVATDLTIEIATTVRNPYTGDGTIEDDDLARLLSYLVIQSPAMGNLTDQLSCTGPILDLVTRFIADAFERSGDAPVSGITVPAPSGNNDVAVTKYFTKPLALRFLDRPLTTAPWLGLLHNTSLKLGLAPDACLDDVSTGATVRQPRVLKASVSYCAVPVWYYPMVAFDRVDNPSSGSNGLTFKNFGGPGPECTQKTDHVHTIGHLSSLKGLGGNLTFDTVTKLLAPNFGLDNIDNLPHLVKARLRAQYIGHIGGVDYNRSGNYPIGTANSPSMAIASLLFFLLVQPSIDMNPNNMLKLNAGEEKQVQYLTTGSRTGEDKFYIGAIRKVSPAKVAEWRKLKYCQLPASVDQVADLTGKVIPQS